MLRQHYRQISTDCKGWWVNNVLAERRWCSLKYEDLGQRAFGTGEGRGSVGRYLKFFNNERR